MHEGESFHEGYAKGTFHEGYAKGSYAAFFFFIKSCFHFVLKSIFS